MANLNMLHSKIVLKGENWSSLATLLGISNQALQMKKNGERGWSQEQIKIIVDHYQLTPDETIAIFFE